MPHRRCVHRHRWSGARRRTVLHGFGRVAGQGGARRCGAPQRIADEALLGVIDAGMAPLGRAGRGGQPLPHCLAHASTEHIAHGSALHHGQRYRNCTAAGRLPVGQAGHRGLTRAHDLLMDFAKVLARFPGHALGGGVQHQVAVPVEQEHAVPVAAGTAVQQLAQRPRRPAGRARTVTARPGRPATRPARARPLCARAVAERASSSSIRSCSLRTSVKICKLMMAAIGNVASKMTAIRYVRSEAVGQEPSNRSMSRCTRRIVVEVNPASVTSTARCGNSYSCVSPRPSPSLRRTS